MIPDLRNFCTCKLHNNKELIDHIRNSLTGLSNLQTIANTERRKIFSCAYSGKYTEITAEISRIDGTKYANITFRIS